MNDHVLLVGEDTFYQSQELYQNFKTIQVHSVEEAITLVDRFDFQAIVAREGSQVLNAIRERGKHTPFLNLTHNEASSDCCGGHLSPEASHTDKANAFRALIKRNHQTDCL